MLLKSKIEKNEKKIIRVMIKQGKKAEKADLLRLKDSKAEVKIV